MTSLLFCLMGPTASGKTEIALKLQQIFPFELISVDSAMVYKGMDIGTAKPSKENFHYLIDICDPEQTYSAGKFCKDAISAIQTIESHGKIAFLTGGTMLYFKAIQKGLSNLPTEDSVIRKKIHAQILEFGIQSLYQKLSEVDPITASKLHPNDSKRIQRALEVYEITGKSMSSFHHHQKQYLENYQVINVGLMPSNREKLKKNIEKRFDQMLEQGLIQEVEKLMIYKDTPAMRAVNYAQVSDYLQGKMDFNTMREKAIIATCQLAKRQMTWLRHFGNIHFFDPDSENVLEEINHFLSNYLTPKTNLNESPH